MEKAARIQYSQNAAQHDLFDLRQIVADGDDENGGVGSGSFVGRQRERQS
jgi:hypothetical protein